MNIFIYVYSSTFTIFLTLCVCNDLSKELSSNELKRKIA